MSSDANGVVSYAPEPQSSMASHSHPATDVRIVAVSEKHYADIMKIQRAFLGSKHCLCCLPLSCGEDAASMKKLYDKHPDKREVAAVAVSGENEQVLGFVQLVLHGMYCDMHKAKPNEAYVESVAVGADARGKGVGTKLLHWCEEVARARGCTFMSLGVVHKNPSIRLYERLGYVKKKQTACNSACLVCFGCCVFGPVICPAGAPNYNSWGRLHEMEKPLQ